MPPPNSLGPVTCVERHIAQYHAMWFLDTPIFLGGYRFTPGFDSGAGLGEEWTLEVALNSAPEDNLCIKIFRFHNGARKPMNK